MVIELTHAQLLQEWRLRYLHEPVSDDCPYTRHDGIDLDRLLEGKMRDWYLDLLDNAPLSMLAPVDIHNLIMNATVDSEGCMSFTMPDNCRRLIAVRAEGWLRDATITTDSSGRTARLQLSPYTRGDASNPVAVIDNREVRLYSLPERAAPRLLKLLAAVETPGVYRFDEKVLSTIPEPDY